jgi:hypothetical protein
MSAIRHADLGRILLPEVQPRFLAYQRAVREKGRPSKSRISIADLVTAAEEEEEEEEEKQEKEEGDEAMEGDTKADDEVTEETAHPEGGRKRKSEGMVLEA